jgi:hypothetical protein
MRIRDMVVLAVVLGAAAISKNRRRRLSHTNGSEKTAQPPQPHSRPLGHSTSTLTAPGNRRGGQHRGRVVVAGVLVVSWSVLAVLLILYVVQTAPVIPDPQETLLTALLLAVLPVPISLFMAVVLGRRQVVTVGLALISLCLAMPMVWATNVLTRPVTPPHTAGGAYLLLPRGVPPLEFSAKISLEKREFSEANYLIIRQQSAKPLKYAILLTGDARLIETNAGYPVREVEAPHIVMDPGEWNYNNDPEATQRNDSDEPSQLFVGEMPANEEYGGVWGTHEYPYVNHGPSRSFGALPTIGTLGRDDFEPDEEWLPDGLEELTGFKIIKGQVATEVSVQDDSWYGAYLPPDETVAQSYPSTTSAAQLLWKSSSGLIRPTFMTINQHSEDLLRNSLFVLALLLGVAGSGLIGAIESFLSDVARRR